MTTMKLTSSTETPAGVAMQLLKALAATAVLATCPLLLSCGQAVLGDSGSPARANNVGDVVAEKQLIQALADRQSNVYRAGGAVTFRQLFPDSGKSADIDDAFRASVLDVGPGRAFTSRIDSSGNHSGESEVDFDDPNSDWRSFHVKVQVAETFEGDAEVGETQTLGLAFGSSLDASIVIEGLVSMKDIVVFTTPGEFVMPYDDSIRPILYDGAFLSPVNGDDVPFPVLREGDGGQYDSLLSRFDTLGELRQVVSE